MKSPVDLLLRHARLVTLFGDSGWGMIDDGALAVSNGSIVWVGADSALPAELTSKRELDLAGALVTPGLIDCHTHLVYAGDRYREFELRLHGASYEEIARAGGGIRSTVTACRAASADFLLEASRPRLNALRAEGVTTIEIKSGYGLDLESELKLLRVARQLGEESGITVRTTFLGAHAVPAEFAGNADGYIDQLIDVMLPAVAAENLADAVDAFCENIGFTPQQVERVFAAANQLGLPVKLHAEQLSDQGGAQLVARWNGLSADHLEWLSSDGIAAMAAAGTVAVMLPAAFYFLRETRLPPIAALRTAKVPLAVATDCNPGTAPLCSLLTAMNMACTLFRMTPDEVLRGVTHNAAQALGLPDRGRLAVGQRADLAVWNLAQPAGLVAQIGLNPLQTCFIAGVEQHVH